MKENSSIAYCFTKNSRTSLYLIFSYISLG